jgi:hypothetical protein
MPKSWLRKIGDFGEEACALSFFACLASFAVKSFFKD